MSPKTLVLGASGFLGSHFIQSPVDEVYQFRSAPILEIPFSIFFDPFDLVELEKIIVSHRLGAIVNCIALANIEDCERDTTSAFKINSEYPKALAKLCKAHSVHLVHVSTDAVLSGDGGILDESSLAQPKSIYGESKLLGEKFVLQASPNFSVARVNFFGVNPRGNSIFDFFYDALSKEDVVPGFSDVFFSPLYVLDTVRALRVLASDKYPGLIHLAGSPISKFRFGCTVAKLLGCKVELVIETQVRDLPLAKTRSLDLSVSNKRMLQIYEPAFSLEAGIVRSIEQRKREVLE